MLEPPHPNPLPQGIAGDATKPLGEREPENEPSPPRDRGWRHETLGGEGTGSSVPSPEHCQSGSLSRSLVECNGASDWERVRVRACARVIC